MTGTVWKQLAPGGPRKRKASTMGAPPAETVRGKKAKTGKSRVFVYVSTTHTVEFSEKHERFILTLLFVSPHLCSSLFALCLLFIPPHSRFVPLRLVLFLFTPHHAHTVSEKHVANSEKVSIPVPPAPKKAWKCIGQAPSTKQLVAASHGKGMFSSHLGSALLNAVSETIIVPVLAPKPARTPIGQALSTKQLVTNSGKGMYSLWLRIHYLILYR